MGAWESVNDIRVQAGEEKFRYILSLIEKKISKIDQIEVPYKILHGLHRELINLSKMTISYTFVGIDIFHYGHLLLLKKAKEISDIHICGLLSDDVCYKWNGNLVMNYEERIKILEDLNCVDQIVLQENIDPTQNLKLIHKKYPKHKITLFQSHQNWMNMPGSEYIKSIDGSILKPEYYPRLSRDFIRNQLNKSSENKADLESFIVGDLSFFNLSESTKANTLKKLNPLIKKSQIEKLFIFYTNEWKNYSKDVIRSIQSEFKNLIVIRSSSSSEDGRYSSNAGLFDSVLNVDSRNKKLIKDSVNKVIDSYKKNNKEINNEQILVQSQTRDVAYSGVIFTRDIQRNAPYYVINYDTSSKTDTVTSGAIDKNIRLIRGISQENIPKPWINLVDSVKEIESLLEDLALDIEFVINKQGKIIIFQVRPLAAVERFITIEDDKIYDLHNSLISEYKSLSKKSLSKKAIL